MNFGMLAFLGLIFLLGFMGKYIEWRTNSGVENRTAEQEAIAIFFVVLILLFIGFIVWLSSIPPAQT